MWRNLKRFLILMAVWAAGAPCLFASMQRDTLSAYDEALRRREADADALRAELRFQEALTGYESLVQLLAESGQDEGVRRKIGETRRGMIMMKFCHNPEVVAKSRFPVKDFLLYYPLKSGSWRQTPNAFDGGAAQPFSQALFYPKGTKDLYFSAEDAAGCRNIYYTRDCDTLWTAPALLGSHLFTPGNEIYPMLSPDGKTLYFASDALYGMGGYDLYKSEYNEETGSWGPPTNLGFPFSSPADDFLFAHSDDGKYAVFASNRECARDSVCLYVLDAATLTREVEIAGEDALRDLCRLVPSGDPTRIDNKALADDGRTVTSGTLAYREQMQVVRQLKDSIYRVEKIIDDLKVSVSEPQSAVNDSVAVLEALLPRLRMRLDEENRKVDVIESEFLQSGAVSGRGSKGGVKDLVGASSAYTFSRRPYGQKIKPVFAAADAGESVFSITPVGRISRRFPQGDVYQIWFLTLNDPATLDDIRGLNPVFERITSPDLKYSYTAGTFPSLQAALAALNRVRLLGFPDARVVLFRNGKEADYQKIIAGP